MKTKTYALLIGINNYNKVSRLKGCVNDIEKVENYLNQNAGPCTIEKLLDSHATKASIVDAFRRIGQEISAADSFLLYYAGHGTQEVAAPVWEETDGYLECIVCYDETPGQPYSYLLSDKELRYLIFELSKTGCHIVTIFDCCHSGDNTRNADLIHAAFNRYDLNERRLGRTIPQRRWEDFIFHNSVGPDEIRGRTVNEFLPQGSHVQIAACESDESAMEVNGEGVFTKTFLKVLRDAGGNISYYDLKNRIRQYLRFVYEQQPRIYTIAATEDNTQRLLFTKFLNNQYPDKQNFIAEGVYNKAKGWLLNIGAIHGISKNSTLYLFDPASPETSYRAVIKQIFIDYSLIELLENAIINGESTVLKASVENMDLYELKLHLKRGDGNPEKLKGVADALINGQAAHYSLTDDEDLADYSVYIQSGFIYITRPKDEYRPLVQPIEFNDATLNPSFNAYSSDHIVKKLIEYLKHISRWNYTRQLQNKQTPVLKRNLIDVGIVQTLHNGAEINLLRDNTNQEVVYADVQPAAKSSLQISLSNQTDKKLFIAVVYLTYNFQLYMHLLERRVELLPPGESVSLGAKSANGSKSHLINVLLPDVVKEYNWPGYKETIKIIIAEQEFNPEALSLGPLPAPYTLKDLSADERTRSLGLEEERPINIPDWTTQTVHLNYTNLFYNKVDSPTIKEMLEWDKAAFFAGGLYAGTGNRQETTIGPTVIKY